MNFLGLRARAVAGGVLAGLVGPILATGVAAQQKVSPPDFSSGEVGWIPIGNDFIAVPLLWVQPGHWARGVNAAAACGARWFSVAMAAMASAVDGTACARYA